MKILKKEVKTDERDKIREIVADEISAKLEELEAGIRAIARDEIESVLNTTTIAIQDMLNMQLAFLSEVRISLHKIVKGDQKTLEGVEEIKAQIAESEKKIREMIDHLKTIRSSAEYIIGLEQKMDNLLKEQKEIDYLIERARKNMEEAKAMQQDIVEAIHEKAKEEILKDVLFEIYHSGAFQKLVERIQSEIIRRIRAELTGRKVKGAPEKGEGET